MSRLVLGRALVLSLSGCTILWPISDPSKGGHGATKAPKAAATGRLTDAQAAELAKEGLATEDPESLRAALKRLNAHTFKSSKVPEREVVLFAQGVMEARLGRLSAAAVPLRKLEKQWPKSPFIGEALAILAEDAVEQNRLKEAEGRLHRALASDIPAERKRKPQELLIWTYMEQGRPQEALPIVQSLRPLDDKERPTEKGLAAILEVLCHAEELEQAKGSHKAFLTLFPKSPYLPRVELAWGRLLGKSGEAKESAQVLRRLIKSHPEAPQADDARLALASLLTDGSLKDVKDMPTAESLLAAVRKGGRAIPKGAGQVVELRLLCGKSQWEEALDLVDRMDPAARTTHPEVKQLWTDAWQAWTAQALEKKALGPLLARMRPGSFGALEPKTRQVALGLLAEQGLLSVIPRLIKEAPSSERGSLRAGALAKVEPESQPEAVVALLPARGGTPEERLARARAQAVLGQWPGLRESLVGAKPGPERIRALLLLLRRPLGPKERPAARLGEAEGWLQKAPEPGPAREPLAILVADLRFQAGDPKGALALYPAHPAAADQRGWVGLMRAQALLALGRPRDATLALKEVRDEAGFKAQRDVLAKGLGAY